MRSSRFLAALTAAMLLGVFSGCGRDDAKQMSNMKQIATAMVSYMANHHDSYPPAIVEKDGKPLLSCAWQFSLM